MDSGERRLVATMPLHAITSTYGEEGLRARFEVEIQTWPGPDQRRLNQALDLAGRLHAADRRDREPYVNHLLRVAIRIISHYGVHDTDVICATTRWRITPPSWPPAAADQMRSRCWRRSSGRGWPGLSPR